MVRPNAAPFIPHAGDLRLARAALAGHPAAKEAIGSRLSMASTHVIRLNARKGSPLSLSDQDEVAQNTVGALWTRLRAYDGRTTIEAWAHGFCRIEWLRFLARRRPAPEAVAVDSLTDAGLPVRESDSPPGDPERLHQVLESLDEDVRRLIHWKCVDELTFREISARTGRPVGSEKSNYYRAITRLRRRLGARPLNLFSRDP